MKHLCSAEVGSNLTEVAIISVCGEVQDARCPPNTSACAIINDTAINIGSDNSTKVRMNIEHIPHHILKVNHFKSMI